MVTRKMGTSRDRNGNGIDDEYEKGLQPINTASDALAQYEKKNGLKAGSQVDPRAVGSGGYTADDALKIAERKMGRPGSLSGTGSSGGLSAGLQGLGARRIGQTFQKSEPGMMGDTGLPSFLANLMESLGFVGGSDVNYDPLRNDARGRGAEYDSRLQAMYAQLQGAMRQDGTDLQQSYQGAIDQNAERTAATGASVQGASDAAAARNLQQLQALGIGEAAGNIVAQGQDLNSDTARAVQDVTARGQLSGDNLQQNQQSAAQHNTNLVGAAGLEGNLQRARVQSELGTLLSQYDMEEQQARQQAQQSSLSQAMSMAGALTDDQWQQQSYKDNLAQTMYEQRQQQAGSNQPSKMTQSMAFLQSLMQSPQFADSDIESLLPYIQALGGIGKLV